MQHRRIPLMVTIGEYNIDQLDTIEPIDIRSLATIRLPKNLDYFDNSQTNNSFSIPLFPKIQNLYKKTENFILDIYSNINP